MLNAINHIEYPKALRIKSIDELEFIIADAKEAIAANPDAEKVRNGYYADEINYCAMEIRRREQVKADRWVKRFGEQVCRDAYRENERGNGASTIGFEFGLTTRHADQAIDAGRFLETGSTEPRL